MLSPREPGATGIRRTENDAHRPKNSVLYPTIRGLGMLLTRMEVIEKVWAVFAAGRRTLSHRPIIEIGGQRAGSFVRTRESRTSTTAEPRLAGWIRGRHSADLTGTVTAAGTTAGSTDRHDPVRHSLPLRLLLVWTLGQKPFPVDDPIKD